MKKPNLMASIEPVKNGFIVNVSNANETDAGRMIQYSLVPLLEKLQGIQRDRDNESWKDNADADRIEQEMNEEFSWTGLLGTHIYKTLPEALEFVKQALSH